jgi:hypothetical protein
MNRRALISLLGGAAAVANLLRGRPVPTML